MMTTQTFSRLIFKGRIMQSALTDSCRIRQGAFWREFEGFSNAVRVSTVKGVILHGF